MMRSASIALAASLALAGCATTGTLPGGGTVDVSNPDQTIATVQAAAVKACGWEPTVATLVELFTANPVVMTADAWARAMCNAVGSKSTALNHRAPTLYGVQLKGTFVR